MKCFKCGNTKDLYLHKYGICLPVKDIVCEHCVKTLKLDPKKITKIEEGKK